MLKLYVVGEDSGDPTDWERWRFYQIVCAGSAEEAERLSCAPKGSVAEIPLDRPMVIATHLEEEMW